MKLAVIIDPIETLNPKKDSTIAMLHAAQEKGLSLFYATQDDLFVENGQAFAFLSSITINLSNRPWYDIHDGAKTPLSALDIIVMRKDPPFDMNYIYTTYLLSLAESEKVLVANKPQALRDANEKYFTSHFPKHCPPTLISQNQTQLKAFWQAHHDVVFKPLDGMGGKRIFHIDSLGKNLVVALEVLTEEGQVPIMAQRYIPEIKTQGDKRVLIIGSQIIPYALARIPQGFDERGNLAQGALGEVVKLSETELKLCQALIPTLEEMGIYFAGIDLIGAYITEINITSPTCIQEIAKGAKLDIAGLFIDLLCKKAKELRP